MTDAAASTHAGGTLDHWTAHLCHAEQHSLGRPALWGHAQGQTVRKIFIGLAYMLKWSWLNNVGEVAHCHAVPGPIGRRDARIICQIGETRSSESTASVQADKERRGEWVSVICLQQEETTEDTFAVNGQLHQRARNNLRALPVMGATTSLTEGSKQDLRCP